MMMSVVTMAIFIVVMVFMRNIRDVMRIVVGCLMDGFVLMNDHRGTIVFGNGEQRDGQCQNKTKRNRLRQSFYGASGIPHETRKRCWRIRFRHAEKSFVVALLAIRMQSCELISPKIRLKLKLMLTWFGSLELPPSAASPL